tara:strand:- start:286 stop:495 length:210 start_codon:yes stop_codon:yes gene_type:complete
MKTALLIICLFLVTSQVFSSENTIKEKDYYQSGYKNNGNGWTNYYQQDFKKDQKRIKEKNKSKKMKKDE